MEEKQLNEDLLNKFCFIFDRKKTISYYLFENVLSKTNTYEIYSSLSFNQGFFSKLYNKYLFKLGKLKVKKSDFKDKIIIFTNESIQNVPNRLLLKIRKQAKAVVLFFIDEQFNNYKSVQRAKDIIKENDKFFDLVYTFSPKDAESYSFKLNETYYSQLKNNSKEHASDLFFVGSLKNRGSILQEILNLLNLGKVDCNFIVSASRENRTNKNFDYRTVSYKDCIRNVLSTNCILDIADERQTGMTLRYYEAVVYNKKLLTNNANVKNMPYYDERYMKVFKDVDDIKNIGYDWFKNNDEIDYGYKGEFEPVNFLKNILSSL